MYARPPSFVIDPTTPPRKRLDILYDELILPGSRQVGMVTLARSIIASGIRRGAVGRVDPIGHLQLLLDWQYAHVEYVEDANGPDGYPQEIFKWAWRAIADKGDDCEGKITVFCTLAEAVGYKAIPIWIEQPFARQNHVAGKVALPLWCADLLPPVRDYGVVEILPSNVPRIAGVWAYVEATLPAVRMPGGGIVPAAQIGEFPYDVQNRQISSGAVRAHL